MTGVRIALQLAGRHNAAPTILLNLDQSRVDPLIERHPADTQNLCGFAGTRVPVAALFENIEGGATVQEFLEWFPGVTAQQTRSVLEHATRSLEVA